MREIEIKVKIDNVTALKKKLRELAIVLSDPVTQHDVVYSRPGAIDDDPNECWLRIRTENDARHIFTLKRSVTSQMDSIEHEVTVDDPEAMRGIIHELGYVLFSDLTKTRQSGHMGPLDICIDTVPKLGQFVELEKLCAESADVNAVREELWGVLEQLGAVRKDEITDGYDVLMRKKFGAPRDSAVESTTIERRALVFLKRQNQLLVSRFTQPDSTEVRWSGADARSDSKNSLETAAKQAAHEKFGVTVTKLTAVAELHFTEESPQKSSSVADIYVYLCDEWIGDERVDDATQWVAFDELPYASMAESAHLWLPSVLTGGYVHGTFTVDTKGAVMRHALTIKEER